jgi:hypothetical protein
MHEEKAVRFLPPVPDPDKFLCVGKNYRAHLEELKKNDLIKEMPGEVTGLREAQFLPRRPRCARGEARSSSSAWTMSPSSSSSSASVLRA